MATTKGKRPERKDFDYAAQWDDAPETEEVTLPSGKVVILMTPNLPRMARQGLIPNHIIGVVEKFVMGGTRALIKEVPGLTDPGAEPGATLMRTADLNAYIDCLCVASMVEPQLSFDGKPGTISVDRLTPDDKFFVWDKGVGLSRALATFRQQSSRPLGDVAAPSGGEDVRDEAEPTDRADTA